MDLKKAHDLIRFFLNKEQGGWFSPEELDDLLDRGQWWLFNTEVDFYAKNQELLDSLSVFSTPFTYTATDSGLVQLPVDPTKNPCYEHLLAIYVQYWDNKNGRPRRRPIKIISEDQVSERLDSQILTPTLLDPVGTQPMPGQIQLYPETGMSGQGYYLRRPLKPFYKYTQAGRVLTYDQSGSVQLEWNESSVNKILIKALQLAGLNINDQLMLQYTELKNKEDI